MRRLLLALVAFAAVLLVTRDGHAGYTHHWIWHKEPDPAVVERAVGEMMRIALARQDILDGKTGGDALFSTTVAFGDAGTSMRGIEFNGIGENAHESFGFPLAPFTADDPSYQFVKTQWKPYDEVVVACLFVAKDHFPRDVLEIGSDGYGQAWAKGARLYERVLERKPKPTLGDPEPGDPADETPRPWHKDRRFVSVVAFACLLSVYLLARR